MLGGDKRSIAGLRGDPRLEAYLAKATDRFLTVPDPRLAVQGHAPRLRHDPDPAADRAGIAAPEIECPATRPTG